MFKKFVSMATATLLLTTGFGVIAATPANAAAISSFVVGCRSGVSTGQVASSVECVNPGAFPEWTLSNASWSPAVSTTFQSNTVYAVTYRATPTAGNTVPNVNANSFTVDTGYAGSPSGTTVTNLAATAGDSYITLTITFRNTSGGGSRTIASTSTIAGGAVNPQITITSDGPMSAVFSHWTINVGTTGLSVQSTNTAVVGTFVLTFRGTARNGVITVQGGANAFVTAPNGPSNTLSFTVTGGSSESSSSSQSGSASADAVSAQYKQQIRVEASRSTLFAGLSADKPGTLTQYSDSELHVKSESALSRVNAKVLELPVSQRTNLEQIAKIVKLENFVDSVPSPEIHVGTISAQLVSNGFISPDFRQKISLAIALRNRDASTIDSVEELKAAVAVEIARLQERFKRTKEIKARIAARQL